MGWLAALLLLVKVGDVDRTLVDRVIKQHGRQLRACFAKTLHAKPDLEGKVMVDFTIEATGKTSHVKARGLDDDLDRCVEKQFRSMVFPRSTAPAILHYPLVFVRGG